MQLFEIIISKVKQSLNEIPLLWLAKCIFMHEEKNVKKKIALFRSRSGSCSWLSPKEVSKVPFIYYVSTWWGGVRKYKFLLTFCNKNMLTRGEGGLKNLRMCLRSISMVPKDDVLSFLVCWGLCRHLGTLETLMLWWKFSLDLGQYYFTTYNLTQLHSKKLLEKSSENGFIFYLHFT